ncbi:hypothetical protein BB558_000027 [Smittium angustum]|uniref:Uncharacterized protein n=1 Tax=Smittium angustum TaxID=133377 RepID=A0A2U1JFB8_SMIAN|nr:hypothetical protein BB558_000027 [Smittium angustum]
MFYLYQQYVTKRQPITDLTVYRQLKEIIPSIEEEFFCSRMTEEEKKDVLYTCPRSSCMNYSPPPLNDSASAGIKKMDFMLYRIQSAIAQATRPIDYYVYRRIQADNGALKKTKT